MDPRKNKFEQSKKRVTFDESVDIYQQQIEAETARMEARRKEERERNESEFNHYRDVNGIPFEIEPRNPDFDPRQIAESRQRLYEELENSPPLSPRGVPPISSLHPVIGRRISSPPPGFESSLSFIPLSSSHLTSGTSNGIYLRHPPGFPLSPILDSSRNTTPLASSRCNQVPRFPELSEMLQWSSNNFGSSHQLSLDDDDERGGFNSSQLHYSSFINSNDAFRVPESPVRRLPDSPPLTPIRAPTPSYDPLNYSIPKLSIPSNSTTYAAAASVNRPGPIGGERESFNSSRPHESSFNASRPHQASFNTSRSQQNSFNVSRSHQASFNGSINNRAFGDSFKTALCHQWKASKRCTYGNDCRFAHGDQELRLPAQAKPNYKTILCRTFSEEGQCPHGSRCKFIHYRNSK